MKISAFLLSLPATKHYCVLLLLPWPALPSYFGGILQMANGWGFLYLVSCDLKIRLVSNLYGTRVPEVRFNNELMPIL